MKEILCIYNANGGLMGELEYVCGKIIGTKHCELCDISHGYNIRGKAEWHELAGKFPIPVRTAHINEISKEVEDFVQGNYPIVIAVNDDGYQVLLSKNDLLGCNKSPANFFTLLGVKIKI